MKANGVVLTPIPPGLSTLPRVTPDAGWKGRGLWSTYGNRTPFHLEGGKGTTSKIVKFQLRPDPLAR